MEILINIILLEGINIESKNNNEICLCHKNYTLSSLFPIKYLNPLLQLVINNRNKLNMNNPLYLGYNTYNTKFNEYKEINLIIEDLKIISTIDNKDIIYEYKNNKNRFPICWLNNDITKLIIKTRR